mmetsp:Transcript_7827/g.9958  ORF Transcript_7827/g.9958 Transcript_7827/m.9958 type:complete len:136 (+) Transcript_7827:10-417(+)
MIKNALIFSFVVLEEAYCFCFRQILVRNEVRHFAVKQYRVYDVRLNVKDDPGAGSDPAVVSSALKKATKRRVKKLVNGKVLSIDRVVRKSLDTRQRIPCWVYVVDATLAKDITERTGVVESLLVKDGQKKKYCSP